MTAFLQDSADEICKRIMKGESLASICRDDFMPARWLVYEWLAANKDFSDNYARAMEVRADHVFDEVMEIADDPLNLTAENLNAARLKIDARKWALGKMQPKKYGDKLELGGNVGMTVTLESDADQL
jgi:hypothetical protein